MFLNELNEPDLVRITLKKTFSRNNLLNPIVPQDHNPEYLGGVKEIKPHESRSHRQSVAHKTPYCFNPSMDSVLLVGPILSLVASCASFRRTCSPVTMMMCLGWKSQKWLVSTKTTQIQINRSNRVGFASGHSPSSSFWGGRELLLVQNGPEVMAKPPNDEL